MIKNIYIINNKTFNMEEYRDIPGFDGRYKISKDGRIISNARNGVRELKILHTAAGYPTVNLFYPDGRTNKKNKTKSLAYLVLISWGSPRPSLKHKVEFIDGNRQNVHIDNLRWITQADIARKMRSRIKATRGVSKIFLVVDGWDAANELFDNGLGYYKDNGKKYLGVVSVYSAKGFDEWYEKNKKKKCSNRGRNANRSTEAKPGEI